MAEIRGTAARIEWGYRTAATLGAWTIVLDRGTPDAPTPLRRRLAAELRDAAIYALRQRPLIFVVPREGRPALRWPVLALEVGPNYLRGELAAKEGSNNVQVRTAGK
jgi:hypothetical protein